MSPPLPDVDEQQLTASLVAAAGLTGLGPALDEPMKLEEPVPEAQDPNQFQPLPVQEKLDEPVPEALEEPVPEAQDPNGFQPVPVQENHVLVADGDAGSGDAVDGDGNPHPTAIDGVLAQLEEEGGEGGESSLTPADPKAKKIKKRCKKLPLSPHEALLFAPRGIYVDSGETGQLRCSCNHKPCDKWDQYGYTRHFGFRCHKRYEEERLDDNEIQRLKDSKATFLRLHPPVEEMSIRKKRKAREGEKLLSVDELRVQERHWMSMWKDAKNELRQLRQDLKEEEDEEVRAELTADIEGLKKRKMDWAKLLGLGEVQDFTVNL